jgi:hypothetical protein
MVTGRGRPAKCPTGPGGSAPRPGLGSAVFPADESGRPPPGGSLEHTDVVLWPDGSAELKGTVPRAARKESHVQCWRLPLAPGAERPGGGVY